MTLVALSHVDAIGARPWGPGSDEGGAILHVLAVVGQGWPLGAQGGELDIRGARVDPHIRDPPTRPHLAPTVVPTHNPAITQKVEMYNGSL